MAQDKTELSPEAAILFKYLTGRQITPEVLSIYSNGVDKLGLDLNNKESEMLQVIMKHQYLIPIVDFGLVRFMPLSNLRRRFLLLSSIIECQPEFVNLFLNSSKIGFPIFRLILLTLKAGLIWFLSSLIFIVKRWR